MEFYVQIFTGWVQTNWELLLPCQEHLDHSLSSWESHVIATYALRWMQLIRPLPHDSVAQLETIQWKHRIQAELKEIPPPPQLDPTLSAL